MCPFLSCQIDNAAWTAAKEVFGTEMKRLLCRWHVDRFAQSDVDANIQTSHIALLHTIVGRNLRKNLYAKVKDKLHQVALYQGLYLAVNETDQMKFHDFMESLISVWLPKEPAFIQYF